MYEPIEPVSVDDFWSEEDQIDYYDADGDGIAGNPNMDILSPFPLSTSSVTVGIADNKLGITYPGITMLVKRGQYALKGYKLF